MTYFKPLTALAVAFAVLLMPAATRADDNDDKAWTEDYHAALKAAKEAGKPLLADFTGSDWCPPCIRLHKDIFTSKEFKAWAKDKVVLLTLDYPARKEQSKQTKEQNEKLKDQYKITGFPTVIFISPEGKELGRQVGYRPMTPEAWIKRAEAALKPSAENDK